MRVLKWFNVFLGIALAAGLLSACKRYHRNKAHPEVSRSSIQQGEALAAVYCQSCHSLPDPALLDAKSWEKGVLPVMGPRLGIFKYNFQQYPSSRNDVHLQKGFYPAQPLLRLDEWQHIIDYYTATSPDSLLQENQEKIKYGLSLFKPVVPPLHYEKPAICFIQADTAIIGHTLLLGDALKKDLVRLNSRLELMDSVSCEGPVVNVDFSKNAMLACNIGVLNPNNGKYGKAESIAIDANGKMKRDSLPLFDSLARPVQLTAADLNADGKTDYLICEFGHLAGALSWMENLGNGQYQRHVIRPVPGAIKVYIRDDNHDGLPDLWVLFAQGEEGIFLFTNKGKGQFSQEEVLRFPPVNGSSYFEFADFNQDGYPDILYTCGDNADYSPILKPYHGLYIFLNDGKNHFKQTYFFAINGCYKAIARDFDGDGDLDIAAIAFFADYTHRPEESFVYLENKGHFEFIPYTLPEARSGRWLTMDAADLDGDGKTDIFLGNFSLAPGIMKPLEDWKSGPPFLVLKNTGSR